MDQNEFRQFWADMKAAFPELDRRIGAMGEEQQRLHLRYWQRALSSSDLGDCLAAIQVLFDDESRRPKAYSGYPAKIREIARSKAADRRTYAGPRYVDGEPTYSCPICQAMDGWVIVYQPSTMRAAVAGRLTAPEEFPYECVVPCICAAGNAHANRLGYRYNPQAMVLVDPLESREEAQERIQVFVAERQHKSPEEQPTDSQRRLTF